MNPLQKASASFSDDNVSIRFTSEATLGDDKSIADLRTDVSASLPDSSTVEVNTASTLRDSSSVWVAREFDGEKGLDLRLSLDVELADGTPYHQGIQIQQDDTILPFPQDTSGHGKVAIGDKGWLAWASLPPDMLASLMGDDATQEDVDPFAETETPDGPRDDYMGLKEIQTPEALARFAGASVFDFADVLRGLGMKFKEHDFAGYDPGTQQIFFYSYDKMEHDKFESLFSIYHSGIPSVIAISSRGDGQMRLVSKSGQKAVLKSTDLASKHTRLLEIEPTADGTDSFVDLRVFYEEKSGEKVLKSLNTFATLEVGKFLTLMEKGSSGGAMEFKAEKLDSR